MSGIARGATDHLFELTEVLGATMERGMAERGLSLARARLLWTLHHHGPRTQREIADLLATTPRNVTGLLDGLAGDGYLVRQPHPNDRRATLVTLTENGRRFTAALRTERDIMADALLGDIPPAQIEAFSAVLGLVVQRLRGTTPPGC
ncbi:MarR family transcriptional regulator [Nocardia sp. NPDC051832]|uniref:MarR family winged helix-turn-helix transcriptional regulator n=1 Tax=Nocardia sp. NPDC051832 TaxID=3155673 RepID=UPI0034486F37